MDNIEIGIIIPVGVVALMMYSVVMTSNPYYEAAFISIAAFNGWCMGMSSNG